MDEYKCLMCEFKGYATKMLTAERAATTEERAKEIDSIVAIYSELLLKAGKSGEEIRDALIDVHQTVQLFDAARAQYLILLLGMCGGQLGAVRAIVEHQIKFAEGLVKRVQGLQTQYRVLETQKWIQEAEGCKKK